jgi:hypothetical protein
LEAIGVLHEPAVLLPYPLDRRLGGPQIRYGRYGKVKILNSIRDSNSNPSFFQFEDNPYILYATGSAAI